MEESKMRPLVTIVTPVYNQEQYLGETIESILAQSYPRIEYIIIDDGSIDRSYEIAKSYESERVKVYTQENQGQPATLNKGWAQAKGKYIGYLSSDDLLHVDAIETLVQVLEKDPDCVCAFPDSDLIDESSKVIKRAVCRPFDIEDLVVHQECYIGPGALFRSGALKEIKGWRTDLKLAPDREFWMRMARIGRFCFIEKSLAGYRLHRKSISYSEVSEGVSREYITVIEDYFSNGDLPRSLVGRKNEALAYAHLIVARNLFRSGAYLKGLNEYKIAVELCEKLDKISVKYRLLRTVISKPIRVFLSKVSSLWR